MTQWMRGAIIVIGFVCWSTAAGATTFEAARRSGPHGQPMCLDVAGGHTGNGAPLIFFPCHGRSNQAFRFHRGSGEIRSELGGWCVDVFRGEATAGNRVHLWTCNGSPAQRFRYDPAAQRLRFAADPAFCVEARDDAPRLERCDGDDDQAIAVSTPYGDRSFDQLTWLTTHNSFTNYQDARWTMVNQSRGLRQQLEDGVRGLMLDVRSFESGTARCVFSFGFDCYGRDLYMCHGDCGGVAGIEYALPRQRLADALATVTDFLWHHPEAIVTVFLEDYSEPGDLEAVLGRVPRLRELLFDPYAAGVRAHGWPLAADLVHQDRRLLLISDKGNKRHLGVGFGPDFTVENYWSIGPMGDDYGCGSRWGSIPLHKVDASFDRLAVINHFRPAPTVITAAIDNRASNLWRRINDHCVPEARRKPNYLVVDFYELGEGRRVAAAIDRSAVIVYQHGGFSGRAQLLPPGRYDVAELSVGDDAISSVQVAPGAAVTMFEHGGFRGAARVWTTAADGVADFNDRASSLVVDAD